MTIMSAFAGAILVAFGFFLVGLTVVVFAKPAVAKRFFMSFASSARAHYTAANSPSSDRRVTRHSLWDDVAAEGFLACGMGHRRILPGVDPYSLAMARSFRRGSASDADSSHETVCGRAIGVRNFTYLWGGAG